MTTQKKEINWLDLLKILFLLGVIATCAYVYMNPPMGNPPIVVAPGTPNIDPEDPFGVRFGIGGVGIATLIFTIYHYGGILINRLGNQLEKASRESRRKKSSTNRRA